MGNKYKKFAAARADMLPIKVQILNYFTNFKDKSTDRMPNVVVDLPDLRIPKYFSHSALHVIFVLTQLIDGYTMRKILGNR